MPADVASLSVLIGRAPIFASGLPYNDLEYTVFDTDYMDGETNGYDTFLPVDPSTTTPGANRIKLISATGNVTLDTTYGGQPGDRIILGTAEIDTPFFLRGSDAIDNDYAVINSFDYKNGLIQLRGSDDFDAMPITNVWSDTIIGTGSKKHYVVQTGELAVARSILMTTDPGDLVLDPTCGDRPPHD